MHHLQGDALLEDAIAELFEDGEIQRYVNRARRVYAARRDHLVELLGKELDGALDFQVPSGGLALWARVREDVDVDAWAACALDHGLVFRTGRGFYQRPCAASFLRLGFGMLDENQLERAVQTLARSLAALRPA